MREVKNINDQARQAYEPVQVKVIKVTPQRILCQSTEESLTVEDFQMDGNI